MARGSQARYLRDMHVFGVLQPRAQESFLEAAHHKRLATAAHMPAGHLGRKRAVLAPVARWDRSDRMAGEALAEPVVGEQASARGSIEHLQEAAGHFVASVVEDQEWLAEQCCWMQPGCASCARRTKQRILWRLEHQYHRRHHQR